MQKGSAMDVREATLQTLWHKSRLATFNPGKTPNIKSRANCSSDAPSAQSSSTRGMIMSRSFVNFVRPHDANGIPSSGHAKALRIFLVASFKARAWTFSSVVGKCLAPIKPLRDCNLELEHPKRNTSHPLLTSCCRLIHDASLLGGMTHSTETNHMYPLAHSDSEPRHR